MNPWWGTVIAAAVTGLLALAAQMWAKRGSREADLNGMAMSMLTKLEERVERLEGRDSWHEVVHVLNHDYIAVLRDWIFRRADPPPPERPVYPPRPT